MSRHCASQVQTNRTTNNQGNSKTNMTATEPNTVLVTGAAKRIGATIARQFHARGFRVIIHYNHSREEARALEQELNQQRSASAEILRADLTSAVDVDRLGQEALSRFGRLDVLINNASSFYPTDLGQCSRGQWDELMDSNLRAAFFLSQALANELAGRRGAIVNIVDTYADSPLAHYPIYSIAKAGLKAMTKSLALELAPNVRVNGVSPGAILWPPGLMDDNDPLVQEKRDKVLQAIPLGQLGKPEQIAELCYFLARDASYVNGQVIKCDGGRSLV